MFQSIPSAMIPYQGNVVLVQHSEKRERAEAKIAATSKPIILIADKPLPATTTQIAGLLPEGKICIAVETANVKLRNIPLVARDDMAVLIAQFADHLIDYEAGILSAHAFQNRVAGVNSQAIQLHGKLYSEQPEPRRDKSAFRDPANIERVRVDKTRKIEARLHQMLVDLLDIHKLPTGNKLYSGDMQYELSDGAGDSFLNILRRTPDGAQWLSAEAYRITTRKQAEAALIDLEKEYQYRTGLLATRPKTAIILRAEVRTIEDAATIIDKMNQEVVTRANAAARNTVHHPTRSPFAPNLLAAGR